jgi:hypothetical protein
MITGLVASLVLIVGYIFYAMNTVAIKGDDLQSWAIALLVFLGISIAANIVVQIVFNIVASIGISVREADCDDKKAERLIESAVQEDEMDKLIDRKANYATLVATGLGFIIALVFLALGYPAVTAIHIIFFAIFLGSFTGGIMSVHFYEVGFSHV